MLNIHPFILYTHLFSWSICWTFSSKNKNLFFLKGPLLSLAISRLAKLNLIVHLEQCFKSIHIKLSPAVTSVSCRFCTFEIQAVNYFFFLTCPTACSALQFWELHAASALVTIATKRDKHEPCEQKTRQAGNQVRRPWLQVFEAYLFEHGLHMTLGCFIFSTPHTFFFFFIYLFFLHKHAKARAELFYYPGNTAWAGAII